MRIFCFFLLLAAPLTLVGLVPAHAAERFGAWQLFVSDGNCSLVAKPQNTAPRDVRRGTIQLTISNRPAQQVFGEVAVQVGYPFSVISEPFALIDGKEFSFFSGAQARNGADEWAWLLELDESAALIDAMRRGKNLIFKGTSARGTLTEDSYSLIGVSAGLNAMNNMNKICR